MASESGFVSEDWRSAVILYNCKEERTESINCRGIMLLSVLGIYL